MTLEDEARLEGKTLSIPMPFSTFYQTKALIKFLEEASDSAGVIRNLLPSLALWSSELAEAQTEVEALFKVLCDRLPALEEKEHAIKTLAEAARKQKEADAAIWSRFRSPRSK